MRDLAEEHAIFKRALEDILAFEVNDHVFSDGYRGYRRGILDAQTRVRQAFREASALDKGDK